MAHITRESFGPRLEDLRRRAKLNQTKLAEILGVKTATVSRWENGQMLPLGDKIERICEYFKVDYEYFHDKSQDDPITDKVLEDLDRYWKAREKEGVDPDELRSDTISHLVGRVAELERQIAQSPKSAPASIPKSLEGLVSAILAAPLDESKRDTLARQLLKRLPSMIEGLSLEIGDESVTERDERGKRKG